MMASTRRQWMLWNGISCRTVFMTLSLALFLTVFIEIAFAGAVPDTGLTKCYHEDGTEIPCPSPGEPFYGQDGNYSINPSSYTKLDENGNELPSDATVWAIIRDNNTGLLWEAKKNYNNVADYSNSHDADNVYTWYDSNPSTNGGVAGTPGNGTDTDDFIHLLNFAGFGGFSDWRLPTLKELRSIAVYSRSGPAITKAIFPYTDDTDWSSDSWVEAPVQVWCMNFWDGRAHYSNFKNSNRYVQAVRGGVSGGFNNFVVNGDGTITDPTTGLMWQQASASGTYTWAQGLSYCENLSLGGYSDWRMPTIKELASIVDLSKSSPAVNPEFFPDTQPSNYWSSTTSIDDPYRACYLYFKNGGDGGYIKYSSYSVRAVRGGQLRIMGRIVISSPIQASQWRTDDEMQITWSTRDLGGDVIISLSLDGGKTFESDIAQTENDGSFVWTVTGLGSVNCALKVTPLAAPGRLATLSLFAIDACPDDPDKINPGVCGCGMPETDGDLDGTPDCMDECDSDPNKTTAGVCGCGVADSDADGDRILDCKDNFPNDPIIPGDLDNDGDVDLVDAILALKAMADMNSADIHAEAEINGDDKIGIEEAIYILQKVAGLR